MLLTNDGDLANKLTHPANHIPKTYRVIVKGALNREHIKSFENDSKMQLLNGRYGPYIAYDGKNYRLPKAMHERVRELTYEECIEIVNNPVGSKRSSKK